MIFYNDDFLVSITQKGGSKLQQRQLQPKKAKHWPHLLAESITKTTVWHATLSIKSSFTTHSLNRNRID